MVDKTLNARALYLDKKKEEIMDIGFANKNWWWFFGKKNERRR
jgi:hypothetical protein